MKKKDQPLILTDMYYGQPNWEVATRGMRACIQPLDRPYLHLSIGPYLHTLHVGQTATVALADGHWWNLKVKDTGQTYNASIRGHQRVKVELEHRHSPRCPCHSTLARGSLEFAVQTERARAKHLQGS